MKKPLLRIPYTGPLPAARIVPPSASTFPGAIAALTNFLTAPPSPFLSDDTTHPESTVLLTGAGISVASGLADYRGNSGTYRLNKTYRPIYHHEFLASHEARKRYWARSFLGWPTLANSQPNATHFAIRDLGKMSVVRKVITQNVDSFHSKAHPELSTLELHGYLRATRCTTCKNDMPRDEFQRDLARLNPLWDQLLHEILESGALESEDPEERKSKGLKTNPDGDVDLPDAPYTTFRYPPCPTCLARPPISPDGERASVEVDSEGAFVASNTAGVLQPAVVMFGETIPPLVKQIADDAIDSAGRLLIVGTSLATYSAWRLARRAKDRGMPVGIINLGGVRGEDAFLEHLPTNQEGDLGVRIEQSSDKLLPALVDHLKEIGIGQIDPAQQFSDPMRTVKGNYAFKDMLS